MTTFREFGTPPPTSRETLVSGAALRWRTAEETPVAFIYNGRNYAVMMATPAELSDFAVGFTLSERIATGPDEIVSIDIHCGEKGVDIRAELTPSALTRFDARQERRNLVGRAGCGVCGVDSSDVFFETLPKVADSICSISEAVIEKAVDALPDFQPLNELTKSVHAAAWARDDGSILFAREDVGRHNALDKLLGACMRENVALADGFLVISSRCSYEIVEKSARLGVRAVVSISAPTAFAVRKAEEAGMALYAMSGRDVVAVRL